MQVSVLHVWAVDLGSPCSETYVMHESLGQGAWHGNDLCHFSRWFLAATYCCSPATHCCSHDYYADNGLMNLPAAKDILS